MPNGAKETAEPKNSVELSFEEALTKLETIVEAMETQSLPLDELLRMYEDGTNLAQACQKKLAAAELKLQQLEKTNSGELRLRPAQVASPAV